MMQSIREAEEGWKADLLRVSSITCAPFMFYFLWLNIQYNSYIEDPTLSQPLSYVDYLLSHMHDFKIMALTVLIASAGVLFGPIFARMRLTFKFGEQLNKLTGKLSAVEENATFHLMVIRRFKQINKVIAETMEHVVQSTGTMALESGEQTGTRPQIPSEKELHSKQTTAPQATPQSPQKQPQSRENKMK